MAQLEPDNQALGVFLNSKARARFEYLPYYVTIIM